MSKETVTNNPKLSFRDYYGHLKRQAFELKEDICKALDIADKTFYNKMNDDGFSPAEKKVIAEKTGIPEEILFPTNN